MINTSVSQLSRSMSHQGDTAGSSAALGLVQCPQVSQSEGVAPLHPLHPSLFPSPSVGTAELTSWRNRGPSGLEPWSVPGWFHWTPGRNAHHSLPSHSLLLASDLQRSSGLRLWNVTRSFWALRVLLPEQNSQLIQSPSEVPLKGWTDPVPLAASDAVPLSSHVEGPL